MDGQRQHRRPGVGTEDRRRAGTPTRTRGSSAGTSRTARGRRRARRPRPARTARRAAARRAGRAPAWRRCAPRGGRARARPGPASTIAATEIARVVAAASQPFSRIRSPAHARAPRRRSERLAAQRAGTDALPRKRPRFSAAGASRTGRRASKLADEPGRHARGARSSPTLSAQRSGCAVARGTGARTASARASSRHEPSAASAPLHRSTGDHESERQRRGRSRPRRSVVFSNDAAM